MTITLPNDSVRLVESGDRVEVWIDRPDTRNAISRDVLAALHAILDDVEESPRFLVVTGGTDGVFASGADLRDLARRRAAEALTAPNVALYERLSRAPLPTVAAIDGYALGGGAELAMACDLRVTTARAVFGQPESSLGLLAGAGGTFRLRALVGDSLARQILFLGRRLDGAQAVAAGLADALVEEPGELMTAANAMVDTMARSTPISLRLAKLAMRVPAAAHPEFDMVAQGLLYEEGQAHDRIRAFLDRKPRSSAPTSTTPPTTS